jgi:hypothetical protein
MILIRAKLKNLDSLLKFIESFLISDSMITILGQTMTLIKSAAMLLENLNGSKLGIS